MEQEFDLQVPETTSAHLLNESYAEIVIGAFEKGLFKLLIFMPQLNWAQNKKKLRPPSLNLVTRLYPLISESSLKIPFFWVQNENQVLDNIHDVSPAPGPWLASC